MRLYELTHLPLHERIFEYLRLQRIVRNRADFCRDYLGRSRSYLNTLEYNKHEPSKDAWIALRENLDSLQTKITAVKTKDDVEEFCSQIDKKLSQY